MTDSLPPFRRQKVLSYRFDRDWVLCAKAYMMLFEMLGEEYATVPPSEFIYGPHGKPYLKGLDRYFCLSHCPRGVLCVVADREVVGDVEEIFPSLDMDLARTCFNELELRAICASPEPCVAFARLWTVKESYLKLTGEGLTDSPRDLLEESVLEKVSFQTVVHRIRGCVSTVATCL